jgi:tRNA-splicing ligase RtcB
MKVLSPYLNKEKVMIPIKTWVSDLEDGAYTQAINLSNLPFAFKHIALMPDCHQGYGMPIGGVMATKGVVVPNAVGVDIGCGMIAARTDLHSEFFDGDNKELLKEIMGKIRKQIPVGFEHNKKPIEAELFDFDNVPDLEIIKKQTPSAKKQLGTLGGGNHFLEIQKGNDGYIWIMIHSGSRNLGFKVANYYNDIAKYLCKQWYSNIPDKELSFLPIKTKEAKDYLEAMNFCLAFAKLNRSIMMEKCKLAISPYGDVIETISIHHNYARWENHFGTNVIVHRKGATSAKDGEIGIIPGSQGTKSYITVGKGNKDSFMSSSHGAGRMMSRTAAIKNLDYDAEVKKMDDLGILHSIRNKENLDEASGAYKDIDIVMENQKDLVDIKVELTPLGVIKG